MDASYMEVEFGKYCSSCRNSETDGNMEPCRTCIKHPMMFGTRKPKNYAERTNFKSYSETRRPNKKGGKQNG